MLTVLVATRNRAEILREVLEGFCHLQQPSSGWKLIVVDNGSTDQTTQVVASFAERLPLHSVSEPKLGKNLALNTGLGLVEGNLTVFTDDDIFPHPDWLIKLREAADSQPAYSMFGGPIVPRWEAPPPRWVQWVETPGPVYGITEPSLKEGPIISWFIFGGNMAIRTSVLQSGIRFDTAMGPRGSSYPIGGETDFVMRLERQGHKAWHVQGAVVEHLVQEAQLNKTWVLQRAIRFGRGQYRLNNKHEIANAKLWMGTPPYLLREILKEGLSVTAAWVSFRQEALFRSRWRFNFRRGQATEARILARELPRALLG